MYFVVGSTIFFTIVCFVVTSTSRKRRFLKQFPSPPANFFLGHVWIYSSTNEILDVTSQLLENYGSIVSLSFGPIIAPVFGGIITTDYKLIECVLSSNKILKKAESYSFMAPWLGSGLLLSDGLKWKQRRKILTPAFHFKILRQFVETFESVANVLITQLNNYQNVPNVEVDSLISLHTLDVICETAMGIKINTQVGENSNYVQCIKEICHIAINRMFTFLKLFEWTFRVSRDYYIQNKLLKIIHEFTSNVIKTKTEMLKGNNKENQTTNKNIAFLDLLLKYSQGGTFLSFDEIREEVDTFMFEGHDTTASGICFTLYCLANNSVIQNKVLCEQKKLFGDEKNPMITSQDLQNMKYLEIVIKEAFRLYPPVPVIGRCTTEDVEFNGCTIPKGINIIFPIYHIHRNPKYFREPEKFDPERFADFDNSIPYAYIPFSAGPRNCIGQKFVMLEIKSTISKIIRHFELVPAIPKHDLVLTAEATLKSITGVRVGLKKRI